MKVKLLFVLSLLACQFSYSQTEKLLKGVVTSDNLLLQNVEVINKTSKKSTTTDDRGEFLIQVKVNDSLLFYAKDFNWKRLKVSKEQIELNNLQVVMFKKPEELEEVVITKMNAIDFLGSKEYRQEVADKAAAKKAYDKANDRIGYDGTIDNPFDFVAIGGKVLNLFLKEKLPPVTKMTSDLLDRKKVVRTENEFATLAKNTCDQIFFTESLKLKTDEIDLFLQFCDADPKSKKLIENNNILSMMDFLSAKNIEFQKLKN
ncbi:hypothetical protein [Flavobacterium sp. M31R6]|uniref:hypothetical protein n=1 Tax=Flavobacterium sp. M31R6 TaxID=2739062 RepID=UPI001569E273|nr:hypothetical protein [Flavobacterium sp. M31R6]QKJ61626.1 hypothetical protein HQN62_00270 [Flavobacterium sp. M31R6]